MMLFSWTARSGAAEYPQLNELGSYLATKPVTVHCENFDKTMLGYTEEVWENGIHTFYPDIYLQPGACTGILRLLRHQFTNLAVQGNDLETLIHEATHIRLNSGDEARVECIAVQTVRSTLTYLHIGAKARQKATLGAWSFHYGLGPEYLRVC